MNYTTSSASVGQTPDLPEILKLLARISDRIDELNSQRVSIESVLVRLGPSNPEKEPQQVSPPHDASNVLGQLEIINERLVFETAKFRGVIDHFNKLI